MLVIRNNGQSFDLTLRFEDYVTAKEVLNMFENNKLPNYHMCELCGRIVDVIWRERKYCNLCQQYLDLVKKINEREENADRSIHRRATCAD